VSIPPRPERPPPETASSSGRTWLAIVLALVFFSIMAVGLMLLSYGFFAPVFAIAGLIFFVTTMHYLLWGWWLGKMIREEAEEDDLE
jgi:hypothetical protein